MTGRFSKPVQNPQLAEQAGQTVTAEQALQIVGQTHRPVQIGGNDLAAARCESDNLLAPIIDRRQARHQPLVQQGLHNARLARQQQAGQFGELAGLERAKFVKHSQNPPLLFGDTGLRQHRADRRHHFLTRPQHSSQHLFRHI